MNINSEIKTAETLVASKKYHDAEILLIKVIAVLESEETNDERKIQLSEAYNKIGLVLYKKVEFVRAQSFYSKAIELNYSFASAYYNRGLIYYRLGSFEAAKKDLEKAVLLEPNNTEFAIGLKEIISIIKSSHNSRFPTVEL